MPTNNFTLDSTAGHRVPGGSELPVPAVEYQLEPGGRALAMSFPPAALTTELVSVPQQAQRDRQPPQSFHRGAGAAAGLGHRERWGRGSGLLVGTMYPGYSSAFFSRKLSIEDDRFENTPVIAIRSLDT